MAYDPEKDFTEIHTDGDRAKVKGIMSGVDNGSGAVVTTVASEVKDPKYGLSEVSTIKDEEIGTHGVPGSKLGIANGETSSNSDLEDEGEPHTGRVGGTDAIVISEHKEAVFEEGDTVAKAMPKGPCGGYLGPETNEGCVNVNKPSACPTCEVAVSHEVCSVSREGGNTCNVTLWEVYVAAITLVENEEEPPGPAKHREDSPNEEHLMTEILTSPMVECAEALVG